MEHMWHVDNMNRTIVPLSNTEFRDFGLSRTGAGVVNTLDELGQNPPNIVLAKVLKDVSFLQNNFKKQTLKKDKQYVMALGTYQQLFTFARNTKIKFLKPSTIKFKNVYRPYKGEDLHGKTLLVFRTGGIGDLLFIQPNLIYLKEKYPSCLIKFACGPQYQSMVENWKCVDEVLDLPFSFADLKNSDYHVLFEGVIERCNQAKYENAYNLFSKWMGLNLPDNLLIPKQESKPEKLIEVIDVLKHWNIQENNFVVMQLRASSPIRTPKPSLFKNIIDNLTDNNINIVLTDSPRQSQSIDDFIKNVKNPNMVFNFSKYSQTLDYSIALVETCKMVIGTDSALVHIAASFNKKIYGIFGPFPGVVRLATYPNTKWVDAKKECSPCYIHGQKPCPYSSKEGYSLCYDNIDIQKINDEIIDHYKG